MSKPLTPLPSSSLPKETPEPIAKKLFWRNVLAAALLYPAADMLAQFMSGQWHPMRVAVVCVVGVLVYRPEITAWFSLLERLALSSQNLGLLGVFADLFVFDAERQIYKLKPLVKAAASSGYFNPLWVTRHMLVLELATHPEKIALGWALVIFCFWIAVKSFVINLPLSLALNYWLQNKVSLKYRFIASIFVSGFFGTLYSLFHHFLR